MQAVKWMKELTAEVDVQHPFYAYLELCSQTRITNGLGLCVLLPQTTAFSTALVANANLAASGAPRAWQESCLGAKRDAGAAMLHLLAVGELAVLQLSADSPEAWDQAQRIAGSLPEVLGAGDSLLRKAAGRPEGACDAEHFSFHEDMLPCEPEMDPSELWRTSVFVHIIAVLGGAAHANQGTEVPALRPFVSMLGLTPDLLRATFWPGLPDNQWHAWRHSALYRHRIGQGNIAVAECECGYRYLLSECIAPTTQQPCGNPNGCRFNHTNGGLDHVFSPGQRLVAVPRSSGYIYGSCGVGCDDSLRPGLWGLIDGEMTALLRRENAGDATEATASTTVRGLPAITFRVLHLLVHASALVAAAMEWAASGAEANGNHTLEVLQQHLQV